MKASTIFGIFFAVLAIFLGFLSYKKVLGDSWLDRADKVASITSFVVSVVAFALSSSSSATLGSRKIAIGRDSNSSVLNQGDGNTITYGDTTTTAEKRSIDALERIKSELLDNFRNLALQIETIESQPPEGFWDMRRSNETELAYQDRAKVEFRDYERFIQTLNSQLKFSGNLTATFQKDLAFDIKIAERANKSYAQQQESQESLLSLESSLQHLTSLNLTDGERTVQAQSLHREKIANAKLTLAEAAAQFCLIANSEDIELMRDSFTLLGVDAQFQPGETGFKAAKKLAAKFNRQKTDVLKARLSEQSAASEREVDRRINDPYLLMLRKAAGLPSTLTKAEVASLERREINKTENDPEKLFELAAFSYLESDGHAATIYFQRALETGQLSSRQAQYAEISIDRLENPQQYGESIGVMIIDLSTGGSFEQAGLRVGDVIITLEKEVVNEPMDIASATAKTGRAKLPMTIVRDGQKQIVAIQGDRPAAAKLTQLIVLNAIQL